MHKKNIAETIEKHGKAQESNRKALEIQGVCILLAGDLTSLAGDELYPCLHIQHFERAPRPLFQ